MSNTEKFFVVHAERNHDDADVEVDEYNSLEAAIQGMVRNERLPYEVALFRGTWIRTDEFQVRHEQLWGEKVKREKAARIAAEEHRERQLYEALRAKYGEEE